MFLLNLFVAAVVKVSGSYVNYRIGRITRKARRAGRIA